MTKVNTKELKEFIATWQDQGSEVADKVTYWNTLLELLGVPKEQIDNKTFIEYEKPIKLHENEHFHGSIDAYIPSTRVLIEQKSNRVDLTKPENRPNGNEVEKITPFQQALRYNNHLGSKERANFLVLSNFNQLIIYDIRDSLDVKPVTIELKDLEKDFYLLDFLVNKDENKRIEKEQKISVKAGELVSKIYNEFANIFAKYKQTDDEKIKHSINTLCVRIVFCLYAEDANLFNSKEQFYNYLAPVAPNRCGIALKELFKVLDTKIEDRTKDDPFWNDENPTLAQFPYVNGGLFRDDSDNDIIIPPFTPELKSIILDDASKGFDWSGISPTVFGAVFESTLNPVTRRQGGMHYTSIENIHKVIDPLFLNDLKDELEGIKQYKNQKTIKEKAIAFQEKLSNLTFFDPACGSGNFLTETFLSLRRLENEAIRLELGGASVLDVGQADDWIKVSIKQFFGIEINDFAVSVAKTAMWIAEDQMMQETQDLLYAPDWNFLPLKTYVNIHEADALKTDWNKVLPNYACHYVIGNPPFVGYGKQTVEQKNDMRQLYVDKTGKPLKNAGKIDFVAGWYYKASQYIYGTNIRVAFVSTSSITQGDQVAPIWKPLYDMFNIHIDFAYLPFNWNSEAKTKAQVVVVIISFSSYNQKHEKYIFDEKRRKKVKNINPYLSDAPVVWISSRSKPLCNVQQIETGNRPADGGHLIIENDDYNDFITKEPKSKNWIKKLIGAKEFLHNKKRYCLWLVGITPKQLKSMPLVVERVKACKEDRLNGAKDRQKLADTPWLFREQKNPQKYLIIPRHSSASRSYVPLDIMSSNAIADDSLLIIPNITQYNFGILESKVHMAWMRAVAGRLGKGYRYSAKIVYNNFPWATPTDEQKAKIEKTAQGILDARANYPESSLADLYDPLLMPPDLRKAHRANDKAVLESYGLKKDASESDIVAHLFKLYEDLTKK